MTTPAINNCKTAKELFFYQKGLSMKRSASSSLSVRAGVVSAALLAGMTGLLGSAPAGASTIPVNKTLAAKVPAALKKTGLVVAADASYAPNEFISGDKVVGMDADLAKAIGSVLGLKVTLVNETFDGIIPGLVAKKYDLGMSSFTDTKVREKSVNFVDYFSAGTSFFVNANGGPAIEKLANLCGFSVAVETGTTEQSDAQAQAKACTKAGKKTVKVDAFSDQNSANLALSSGRDQVGMADSPIAAYQVKQSSGKFKLSGAAYGTAPYGIAIPKTLSLNAAVLGAVKVLIADGQYKTIMKRWGVQAGSITKPAINGATS